MGWLGWDSLHLGQHFAQTAPWATLNGAHRGAFFFAAKCDNRISSPHRAASARYSLPRAGKGAGCHPKAVPATNARNSPRRFADDGARFRCIVLPLVSTAVSRPVQIGADRGRLRLFACFFCINPVIDGTGPTSQATQQGDVGVIFPYR
jgi:hypothetical protein